MCGIVAILAQDRPVEPDTLQRALDRLAHRGPDGESYWLSENQRVSLGHRRLSIIDLTTGSQPIANEDGQIRIVVNGEFYDFDRIRAQLIAKGHRFQTHSDSEIAVHLYEEHGLNFLDHLRGEFAFVLWDAARRRLIAARDRFGIKPLFYSEYQSALYLASEAKALFAAGVPAAWDQAAVYRQLFMCYRPTHSLFQGIQQIPPAHLLIDTDGERRLQRYWDFSYPRQGAKQGPWVRDELIQHIRQLLNEAIGLRLRADVPVGVMLSGGLDSSSALGFASALSAKPPAAFSIAFPDAAYDESAIARRTAAYHHADFYPLLVTEANVAEHFSDSVWHGEMVQYNAHGTARYLLSRLIHDSGYKVVLGGEGSDEIFAGYDFLQVSPERLAERRFLFKWLLPLFRLARPATSAQRVLAETSPWLARLARAANLPQPLINNLANRMRQLRALLAPEFLAQFQGFDPYQELFHSIQGETQLPEREYPKQLVYVWLKTFFANYHMAADRLDMSHSVEVRLPFLDHVLFEYVSQLPIAVLTAPEREKALLRDIARPHIPDWIYDRTKKPFLAPPTEPRADGPLYTFIQSTLRSESARSVPFFNSAALVQLLDSLTSASPQEHVALDHFLMLFTSLCILHERFRL